MINRLTVLSAFIILTIVLSCSERTCSYADLNLNGEWEYGIGREYQGKTEVPGITLNPEEITPGTLWYKTVLELPEGDWDTAVLELKGARFRPSVYIDSIKVSSSEGGMTRTLHPLKNVAPGKLVTLEISLLPLSDVPVEDASYIPGVDQWRSNCSSCLWDDVVLHLYKGARVNRVLVYADTENDSVRFKYRVEGENASKASIRILDSRRTVKTLEGAAVAGENEVEFSYKGLLQEWTPENPACYTMVVNLLDENDDILSSYEQTIGLKEFSVADKQFRLNGSHYTVRGGSIVWHRWVRDENAREINYDVDWYRAHVTTPIKERGGNYLRFHLGIPPERFLDLCDEVGLLVQYEWSFFHGMPASYESLVEQYAQWLDVASRHPSVALYHPYNETSPEELERVWRALNKLCPEYPDMVLAERDVNHIHRYWWGMSENLGLYYDSYKQFIQPIMVDEFGGFYIDEQGEMGAYPMIPSGTRRWLADSHDVDERLYHQCLATGKLGEYWRRLGAAGIGAFAIASSYEDGNNWYMGDLREGNLKPVWDALTSVWSSRAVSMELWDRNFYPSQTCNIPLHYINDSDDSKPLKARLEIYDAAGKVVFSKSLEENVASHDRVVKSVEIQMPRQCGSYRLCVTTLNPDKQVKRPVVSEWNVEVLDAVCPEKLSKAKVYVPEVEKELLAMAEAQNLNLVGKISDADVILAGVNVYSDFEAYKTQIDEAVKSGISVVMLDAGDRFLGKQYIDGMENIGAAVRPIQTSTDVISTPLFAGLTLNSAILHEGESHIHPAADNDELWFNLKKENTRLWNGLRGGLIVPSAGLELQGLSQEAYLKQWTAKGADVERIRKGPYFAYDHQGFYEFSDRGDDETIKKRLKDKVFFLIQDMPALDLSLDKNAPVQVYDLHKGYMANYGGRAEVFVPLASSGKDLVKTPVLKIRFGQDEGCLVLSQLLTAGRLAEGFAPEKELYPVRYDEAAVQFVLNMLESALNK